MRLLLLTLCSLLWPLQSIAKVEADYVKEWCPEGAVLEYQLSDKARVDCLTEEYAVEADYAKKWAESIGQAFYYAANTGKDPAVLLIVGPNDWRYVHRLFSAIQYSGRHVEVFFIQK